MGNPLRKKQENNNFIINDYINPTFEIGVLFNRDQLLSLKIITNEEYEKYDPSTRNMLFFDKNYKYLPKIINLTDNELFLFTNQPQFLKENQILSKFINYSDKSNLNVPINTNIRKEIDFEYNEKVKKNNKWPTEDYFEIISLAQHYGMPTCALDWSYNYKHALYFTVINILENDYHDGVLWAFNYKKFEKFNKQDEIPLYCYRPQYAINDNLSAQKGLLTIWQNKIKSDTNFKSLEIRLIEEMEKYIKEDENGNKIYENNDITFSSEKKLFYKFIIPNELKLEILNELYGENISEEFLFPGYAGVIKSIKNKVKLDEMKNKNKQKFLIK